MKQETPHTPGNAFPFVIFFCGFATGITVVVAAIPNILGL